MAALTISDSKLEENELRRVLVLLEGGSSVVVAGTWASGRIELARAIGEVARVPVLSTVYADICNVATADAAAVIECIEPSSSLRGVRCHALPNSTYSAADGEPSEVAGLLSLVGRSWQLTSDH